MIQQQIQKIIEAAVKTAYPEVKGEVTVEKASNPAFGDYACNVAMTLVRELKLKPRVIAETILKNIIDVQKIIESSSIDGPGFLNFRIKAVQWIQSLEMVSRHASFFGRSEVGKDKKVVVEFVSANPTGPLHIGNARGGPLGDAIASLLQHVGYEVVREFYLNDIGGQIDKLGESILVWMQKGLNQETPSDDELGYKGDYVRELSEKAHQKFGTGILSVPKEEAIHRLGLFGIDYLSTEIKKDCEDMGIRFDSWIFEKDILSSKATEKIIDELKAKKMTVEKEGALWFVPNDEFIQDRECVLVRTDGRPTYFANDIAYHAEKYRRGFDRLINIWGSNHHGHVPRVLAAMQVLGCDPAKLETVLYQYVRVKRGTEAIKMSKRGGNFVIAREVLDEVGRDPFRFFLLMRAPDSHLDFDLELAKQQTSDNPVYYVQYAHARISSILAKARDEGKKWDFCYEKDYEKYLIQPEEVELAKFLLEYPETVSLAATQLAPHRVAYYLMDLARLFQHYYDRARADPAYRILLGPPEQVAAKLYFIGCIQQVLRNGLGLLGISAPEKM